MFPYYLSIGMSYEEYWQKDPGLVVAYRKAEELRNEKRNEEMWLQGMYIYEALCDVSVVIPRVSKRKVKPVAYPTKPYPLRSEQKRNQEREARAKMEKMKAQMEAFATRINQKFTKRKGGVKNVRHDD